MAKVDLTPVEPSPTVDPDIVDSITTQFEYAAAAFLIVLLLAFIFVWAILRAAKYEAPASLVVALSLLTFLALAGAIGTGSTELTTLAATGIGALAGAVSSQFVERGSGAAQDDVAEKEEESDG